MADSSKEIDSTRVPDMMTLNAKETLEKASSLCVEMRESADYCKRLLDRLSLVSDQLAELKEREEQHRSGSPESLSADFQHYRSHL